MKRIGALLLALILLFLQAGCSSPKKNDYEMADSTAEGAEEAVEEEPKRIESVPVTERCDGMTFKIGD